MRAFHDESAMVQRLISFVYNLLDGKTVSAGEWWALASSLTSCPVWLVRCVAVLTKPSRLIYISTGWCDTVG